MGAEISKTYFDVELRSICDRDGCRKIHRLIEGDAYAEVQAQLVEKSNELNDLRANPGDPDGVRTRAEERHRRRLERRLELDRGE